MPLQLTTDPLGFIFWLAALVVAITVHEFAHAYAAEHLGDPTPRLQGRLTLNPLAHLDPLGTLMLLIARFGWGKPVQFDPFNLRSPRRDSAIISLAGPGSNIALALICSFLYRFLPTFTQIPQLTGGFIAGLYVFVAVLALLKQLVIMNVVLAVFNLIPVHPLDGFKIVGGMLSEQQARQWYELERYGMIFLLFLIFPFGGVSPISRLISPVIDTILSFLLPLGV